MYKFGMILKVFLQDFWVVKAWPKWLLRAPWKLKPSIFAQSLGKSDWMWPYYIKASIALLKIKENITALKQMDCWLQAIIWGYLNSQKPLVLSPSWIPLLGNLRTTIHFPLLASMFVSISFPFFSHKSFVLKLSASSKSLWDLISLSLILPEICILCEISTPSVFA